MEYGSVDFREILEDMLLCSICSYRFDTQTKKPIQLFCGHTFWFDWCTKVSEEKTNKIFECPICRKTEVRQTAALPQCEQMPPIFEKIETRWEFHPDSIGDMYWEERLSWLCEYCVRCFVGFSFKDTNSFDISKHYGEKIIALRQQLPELDAQLQTEYNRLAYLNNQERHQLFLQMSRFSKGEDWRITPPEPSLPPPPSPHTKFEDGSYRFLRFTSITPYRQQPIHEGTRCWFISSAGNQVDALVITSSNPVNLIGVEICKEAREKEGAQIDFFQIVQGNRTDGRCLFQGYEGTPFPIDDDQTIRLDINPPVKISDVPVTLKLRVSGKGLYFGEASSRVQEPTEFDGTLFKFSDPVFFAPNELQNGKCSIWGPFISIYYQ